MTTLDPSKSSVRLVELGIDWAEKDAIASLLEESKKSVKAQLAVQALQKVKSVSHAELLAEADEIYVDHIRKMVEARRIANLGKVHLDGGRVWVDLTRTIEANKRAEMNMR